MRRPLSTLLKHALSGNHQNPGTVGVPATRRFDPGTRPLDAENQILEHYADNLGPSSRGTINLYSELEVCPSCSSVIEQFRDKFPGIELNVTWG